jgi:hypothetical protein
MTTARSLQRRGAFTAIAIAAWIIVALIMWLESALAEPLPQPKLGATCPPGYETSAGYCVPNRNTGCRAMPKLGATCPVGYTSSGGTYCKTDARAGDRRKSRIPHAAPLVPDDLLTDSVSVSENGNANPI